MKQQMNINMNLGDCDNLGCDGCGFQFFTDAMIIKRIPGVMVGSVEDIEQPVQILLCGSCGKPRYPWKEKVEESKIILDK
jgi:hypothetical protein